MSELKRKTRQGLVWKFAESSSMQLMGLVFSVFLARALSPRDFGIMALTAIFFAVAGTLSNMGFATALIRKVDRTEEDICTVFWYNLAAAFLLAVLLALAAPFFVWLFKEPALLYLTYCSAAFLFINALSSVHLCLFTCRLDFKRPMYMTACSHLIAMPCCLAAAYAGWGYWAFVVQSGVQSLVMGGLLWGFSPWRPRFIFSWASFKNLFAFGSRTAAIGLSDIIFEHSRGLFIAKLYGATDLGFYNRAWKLAATPPGICNGILGGVMFPIMAALQDEPERLLAAYRRYMRVSSMVIFFCLSLFLASAQPIIILAYTEKWAYCARLIQILIWGFMGIQFDSLNNTLLAVKGRADLQLRINLLNKFGTLLFLVPAAMFSVEAICWSSALYTPFGFIVSAYYSRKLYGLGFRQQAGDIFPYLIYSLVACLPCYGITFLPWSPCLQLLLALPLSFGLYVTILWCCGDAAFAEARGAFR